MPTPTFGSNAVTLSAMLTPALLMTATCSLIISTSNRMSRIIDRIRVLIEQADRFDRGGGELDYPEERAASRAEELRNLEWRSDRVRAALSLLYLSLCAFVATSLALAIDAMAGSRNMAIPTGIAVIGVSLLLGACIYLASEARRALRSNRREIQFHRELLARRRVDRR